MPRKPRFYIPDVPVHVVRRGNNREPIFFDVGDYQAYLGWLGESAERYGCFLHAYVLMTNHIHLFVTPKFETSISQMMQTIGRHYVPYINHNYNRSGTLWEGRYKSSLIQDDVYLLNCMRYIELNPVLAKLVKTAVAYRWSSYAANARGIKDSLITHHEIFLALGRTKQFRQDAYKALFKANMEKVTIDDIRAAWQTGTPLGNEQFREKIEQTLQVKVGQAKRGRPKKAL